MTSPTWISALAKVGKLAASFVPGGAVAVSVLEGLGGLAGAVGGEPGKHIEEGIKKISEGLDAVGRTPYPPETQIKIDENRRHHERMMARYALENKKLMFSDQAGGRDVVKTALLSDDPVVRQARPRMMTLMGKSCIAFAFLAPSAYLAAAWHGVSAENMNSFITIIQWVGGFLYGSFTTAFTGYTVARSVDKRTSAGAPVGKILSAVSKLAGGAK